ncbi:MAG: hypothetical protein R2867_37385 [Caldilineaceae bacterium]
MNLLSSLIKRNPFTSFVILTYLFSWWPSLLYVWGMSPIGVAAFGPFIAALVVLAVTEGKPGLKTLLRRIVHWRVGWQWYLIAARSADCDGRRCQLSDRVAGCAGSHGGATGGLARRRRGLSHAHVDSGVGRHMGRTRMARLAVPQLEKVVHGWPPCGRSGSLSSSGVRSSSPVMRNGLTF